MGYRLGRRVKKNVYSVSNPLRWRVGGYREGQKGGEGGGGVRSEEEEEEES